MEILFQLPLPDSIKRITEKVIIIGSDHQQHFALHSLWCSGNWVYYHRLTSIGILKLKLLRLIKSMFVRGALNINSNRTRTYQCPVQQQQSLTELNGLDQRGASDDDWWMVLIMIGHGLVVLDWQNYYDRKRKSICITIRARNGDFLSLLAWYQFMMAACISLQVTIIISAAALVVLMYRAI